MVLWSVAYSPAYISTLPHLGPPGKHLEATQARNSGGLRLTWKSLELGDQNARSRGVAAFQVAVRFLCVFERIFLIHRDLDRAARHHLEQVLRDREQVLAFGRIGVQRWTGREQRTFGLQEIDVE